RPNRQRVKHRQRLRRPLLLPLQLRRNNGIVIVHSLKKPGSARLFQWEKRMCGDKAGLPRFS
ncbi:hypothetical protein, partial [Mesorhizobium sp.]|uniref:hypothetical protein n=1 Tax=Mesorhizobium sp. TaxID=1871066 RepID=UPI0025C09B2A